MSDAALDHELRWLRTLEAENLRGGVPGGHDGDWLHLRSSWRRSLGLETAEEARGPQAIQLAPEAIRDKRLVAGRDWSSGLVTPHQLELSPDLELVGRIHQR